jgi:type II secretory pathway component PulF
MSRPAHSPLPYQVRADLFAHLAAMEKAGLPPDKAFALLRVQPGAQPRLEQLRKLLARGANPAVAGLKSGLFTVFEAALLRAALAAGSPASTYKRLADNYTTKAAQLALMKARFSLPVATLTLALFLRPLPGLVTGTVSTGAYLWQVLRPIVFLGGLGVLAVLGPAWFLSGAASPGRMAVERVLLGIPLFGPMHIRRNTRDFFESLALLVEAGVPLFDAIPTALDTINNSVLRAQFEQILPALKKGATLAQALTCLTMVDAERLVAFVGTGEASGTLPEMLFRHVNLETERVNLFQQQLAEWLPRIFYACVAGWMAAQLIGGGAPAPLPADL